MTPQRIAVVGAGAVGGHLAARLALAGHEVSVLARGAHLQAIQRHGLRFRTGEGPERTARVLASDSADKLPLPRWIFLTVKSTGVVAVASAVHHLMGSDGVLVSAQNGLPWWYETPCHSALAPLLESRRVVGAVIQSSNRVCEPGVVENTSPLRNDWLIGELDDQRSARVDTLRKLLIDAGLGAPAPQSLRREVWSKLLRNLAGSSLCALTRRDSNVLAEDSGLLGVFRSLVEEAAAIAAAEGHAIPPESLPRVPVPRVSNPHKPSMLQDLEAGRPMELESILGLPQALARRHGVLTPTLDTIVALLRQTAVDA